MHLGICPVFYINSRSCEKGCHMAGSRGGGLESLGSSMRKEPLLSRAKVRAVRLQRAIISNSPNVYSSSLSLTPAARCRTYHPTQPCMQKKQKTLPAG